MRQIHLGMSAHKFCGKESDLLQKKWLFMEKKQHLTSAVVMKMLKDLV